MLFEYSQCQVMNWSIRGKWHVLNGLNVLLLDESWLNDTRHIYVLILFCFFYFRNDHESFLDLQSSEVKSKKVFPTLFIT